jgi:hypothetical protein
VNSEQRLMFFIEQLIGFIFFNTVSSWLL